MFCTKCGKENPTEARFCQGCGTEIVGGPQVGSGFHTEQVQSAKKARPWIRYLKIGLGIFAALWLIGVIVGPPRDKSLPRIEKGASNTAPNEALGVELAECSGLFTVQFGLGMQLGADAKKLEALRIATEAALDEAVKHIPRNQAGEIASNEMKRIKSALDANDTNEAQRAGHRFQECVETIAKSRRVS